MEVVKTQKEQFWGGKWWRTGNALRNSCYRKIYRLPQDGKRLKNVVRNLVLQTAFRNVRDR